MIYLIFSNIYINLCNYINLYGNKIICVSILFYVMYLHNKIIDIQNQLNKNSEYIKYYIDKKINKILDITTNTAELHINNSKKIDILNDKNKELYINIDKENNKNNEYINNLVIKYDELCIKNDEIKNVVDELHDNNNKLTTKNINIHNFLDKINSDLLMYETTIKSFDINILNIKETLVNIQNSLRYYINLLNTYDYSIQAMGKNIDINSQNIATLNNYVMLENNKIKQRLENGLKRKTVENIIERRFNFFYDTFLLVWNILKQFETNKFKSLNTKIELIFLKFLHKFDIKYNDTDNLFEKYKNEYNLLKIYYELLEVKDNTILDSWHNIKTLKLTNEEKEYLNNLNPNI
jgi:hypothetical protein